MTDKDLTPIQANTKKTNTLHNTMAHIRFVVGVMTDLPDKYTAEEVEKQIKSLIRAQNAYVENARERIRLFRPHLNKTT